MFNYIYCPIEISGELENSLQKFNYKAQLAIDGEILFALGNSLLKMLPQDKFFEILIFIPEEYNSMKTANLLYRLSKGGARIGLIENPGNGNDWENFALFDNRLLLSNTFYPVENDLIDLITKKKHDFEYLFTTSRKLKKNQDSIEIYFSADRYFIPKNGKVRLNWSVKNSDLVILNPDGKVISNEGDGLWVIEKDTLFSLTAKNHNEKKIQSIFIKCLDDQLFEIRVLVYRPELSQYLPLESIGEDPTVFLVFSGDLVRIEWSSLVGFKVEELSLGQLKNKGYYNLVSSNVRDFEFYFADAQKQLIKKIKIIPVEGPDSGLVNAVKSSLGQRINLLRTRIFNWFFRKNTN